MLRGGPPPPRPAPPSRPPPPSSSPAQPRKQTPKVRHISIFSPLAMKSSLVLHSALK